jgi:UDP-N-acetylglucosamine 2-epimerase (non-hydrolysing)
MIDSLRAFEKKAISSQILQTLGLRGENGKLPVRFALLTLHRPSNVDCLETFLHILDGLEELSEQIPIVFPVHPRTRERVRAFGLEARFRTKVARRAGILLTDPLGYLDFLCLMKNAQLVVTDSGGIQEETTALGVRCITVRDNTERPVTIKMGTNVLAGTDTKRIAAAVRKQMETTTPGSLPEMWDGKAAERIVRTLHEVWLSKTTPEEAATVAGRI